MEFYKYHGAGNDFIIIDNRAGHIKEREKKGLAVRLCNRNFGIGGDGLILVESSKTADAKMRIFNPDGSEAEMCGNGIRCFGVHIYEHSLRKETLQVETGAGIKELTISPDTGTTFYVEVDMGTVKDIALDRILKTDAGSLTYSYVNTGVPHVVIIVENVETTPVEILGPIIRRHAQFPKGTNVNFVQKIQSRTFKIRTYERGVEKETLACGTGITAAGVILVSKGYSNPGEEVEFHAKGGKVYIRVGEDGGVLTTCMRGPVEYVFRGEIP